MKLSNDYTCVGSSRIAALNNEMIQRILDRHGSKLSLDDFQWIHDRLVEVTAKADLLAEWVVKSISQGSGRIEDIRRFENMARFYFNNYKTPKFKNVVERYAHEEGKQLNPKNILDFTLYDLEGVFDLYEQPEVHPRVYQLQGRLPEGASLFYDGGEYQIVEVRNPQTACQLSSGTKWCTSDEDLSSNYLEVSPLYIIYLKGKKTAQFHAGMGGEDLLGDTQLMDLRDRPILPDKSLGTALWRSGLLPGILDIAIDVGFSWQILESPEIVQRWLRFPADEIRKFVTKDPYFSLAYAVDILDGPFPEGERSIASNGETSFWYAMDVLHGRFPKGEPAIINSGGKHLDAYLHHLSLKKNGEYESFVDQNGDNPKVSKLINGPTFNPKYFQVVDEYYGQ